MAFPSQQNLFSQTGQLNASYWFTLMQFKRVALFDITELTLGMLRTNTLKQQSQSFFMVFVHCDLNFEYSKNHFVGVLVV